MCVCTMCGVCGVYVCVCTCLHCGWVDSCVNITQGGGTQEGEGDGRRVDAKGSHEGVGLEKTRGKVERLHREGSKETTEQRALDGS